MSQSLNLDAILYLPWVKLFRQELLVPHFYVQDISKINPEKLKEYGFKGLIFDKDNTLTAPYWNAIYDSIEGIFERIIYVFGRKNILINSNSAGTRDDKENESKKAIERDLGIHVLEHDRKKPGGKQSVIDYYNKIWGKNWNLSDLVMIGDRIPTDIVFGNRYGMLTVLTQPFTEEGDNRFAAYFREREIKLLHKLVEKRVKAPYHTNYHQDICSENLI